VETSCDYPSDWDTNQNDIVQRMQPDYSTGGANRRSLSKVGEAYLSPAYYE